jgi:hypothetical protein
MWEWSVGKSETRTKVNKLKWCNLYFDVDDHLEYITSVLKYKSFSKAKLAILKGLYFRMEVVYYMVFLEMWEYLLSYKLK